jgi:hypothetical protein
MQTIQEILEYYQLPLDTPIVSYKYLKSRKKFLKWFNSPTSNDSSIIGRRLHIKMRKSRKEKERILPCSQKIIDKLVKEGDLIVHLITQEDVGNDWPIFDKKYMILKKESLFNLPITLALLYKAFKLKKEHWMSIDKTN